MLAFFEPRVKPVRNSRILGPDPISTTSEEGAFGGRLILYRKISKIYILFLVSRTNGELSTSLIC
jgi:hypothetical protein